MTRRSKTDKPRIFDGVRVGYDIPIYVDHLEPYGKLPATHPREASACWYFCGLAIRMLDDIPSQVTYEGDTDVTVKLKDLARAVQIQFNFDTLEEFLKFSPACRKEAFRLNRHWPSRLQAWFDSGGRAYDELSREPED